MDYNKVPDFVTEFNAFQYTEKPKTARQLEMDTIMSRLEVIAPRVKEYEDNGDWSDKERRAAHMRDLEEMALLAKRITELYST